MSTCLPYNAVIDVQFEPETGALYPVTLDELKRHLNLQFDTAGSYEFNDDDAYLTDLISAATDAIGRFTGLSLIRQTVTAILRNDKGGQYLPYGPYVSDFELEDKDGETIVADDYTLRASMIIKPKSSYLAATYLAGYLPTTIPAALKMAVLHQCAFLYDSRGNQGKQYVAENIGISESARALAKPFKKTTWLL